MPGAHGVTEEGGLRRSEVQERHAGEHDCHAPDQAQGDAHLGSVARAAAGQNHGPPVNTPEPPERRLLISHPMWVEAVLLAEDLDRLVTQLTPMTIAVGASHLVLSEPGPCVLVPDIGLRVVCKAKVNWPVLGVDVPITARALTLLLRPRIAKREGGDVLVVTLEIEDADLAGVPGFFEERITELVNKELIKKEVELTWGFAEALTHSFSLPEALAPLDSLDLAVMGGRVRIMSDGLGLAVKLDSGVKRHDVATARSGDAR
jgi:hypothetical protein